MEHPKPSVTADIIIFDRMTQEVCLIKRKNAPFKDSWAIPGGFFDPLSDVSIEAAARRELREETNLDLAVIDYHTFGYSHLRDEIGRDPRGRVISLVYFLVVAYKPEVRAQDDAKEYGWFRMRDILDHKIELAFDHQQALEKFFSKP